MSVTAITILPPDTEAIRLENAGLLARVTGLSIVTVDDHAAAQRYRGDLTRGRKAVESKVAPIIASANATHKMLTALRGELLAPFDTALVQVDAALNVYEAEAKRIADEQRRVLEAAARKEAEERQRVEAERIAAEAKAAKERAAAEAKAAREEGDKAEAKRIREKAALDAAAAEQQRQAVLAAPVIVAPVHVAPAVASVKGNTSRLVWHGECHELIALVRHVAEHPEDVRYLATDPKALNEWARETEGRGTLPGCVAVSEVSRRSV